MSYQEQQLHRGTRLHELGSLFPKADLGLDIPLEYSRYAKIHTETILPGYTGTIYFSHDLKLALPYAMWPPRPIDGLPNLNYLGAIIIPRTDTKTRPLTLEELYMIKNPDNPYHKKVVVTEHPLHNTQIITILLVFFSQVAHNNAQCIQPEAEKNTFLSKHPLTKLREMQTNIQLVYPHINIHVGTSNISPNQALKLIEKT